MTGTTAPNPRVAVLDACALVPIRLATTLLWLAEAGIFELLWSEQILDEVQRNLPKLGISEEKAAHRVRTMRDAFGTAALVDDFDHLIETMPCDQKDRHVYAAAMRAEADTLVTFNLKDFPLDPTPDWPVEVTHPDIFLTRLLAEDPHAVVQALNRGCANLRNPPQTATQFLALLTATVPTFANLAADQIRSLEESHDDFSSPITALVSADEDEVRAAFGKINDLTDPAQVAIQWWAALLNSHPEVVWFLSYDPNAWGDYQRVVEVLADRSLASRVIRAVDDPERIAFMRFIPEVAATSQVFAAFVTTVTFLILVRLEDGTWRVWGLGPALLAARDIPVRRR